MAKKIGVVLLVLISFLTGCQKANSLMSTENQGAKKTDRLPVKDAVTDPLELPIEAKVAGEHMKVFLVAYSSFKSDPSIPEEKRNIENYQIEFRRHGDLFYVLFHAKRKPDESEIDGGESSLGKDVIYTISKKDFTIVDKKFYR